MSDRKFRVSDQLTAHDQCDRFVTEMWMAANVWLQEGQVRGLTEVAAQELGARIYDLRGHKKCAETKREMKKRTKFSPDCGDAVCGFIEICRRKGYVAGAKMTGGVGVIAVNNPMNRIKNLNQKMWNPTFGV